jgi:DNA-binding transcriptional regulator YiaG
VDQAGTAARKNKREQRKEQNAAVEDAMAAGIEVKELRDIVELEQKTFKSPKKPRR